MKILGEIFIVDDDPLVLMNYSDILEDAGYLPITALNLTSAWNIIQTRSFDLMLCDHDLTDGKGIDLLSKMIKSNISLPVLYLTAASPSLLNSVRENSLVKEILSKPVSKNNLLDAISKYMESQNTPFSKLIQDNERNDLFKGLV